MGEVGDRSNEGHGGDLEKVESGDGAGHSTSIDSTRCPTIHESGDRQEEQREDLEKAHLGGSGGITGQGGIDIRLT
uniref:Uncharacterized protein n=1 Tax=Panagrellus redivivus TaxID=6233 RepID=A0A7E4ZRV6_PANRE